MKKISTPKNVDLANLVKGVLEVNADGFGFVTTGDGTRGDIFVPPNEIGGAVNRDTVLVRVYNVGTQKRGEVVKVVSRGNLNIVGTFTPGKHGVFDSIVPDDQRLGKVINIRKGNTRGAKAGEKVVIRMSESDYGDGFSYKFGQVHEILGSSVGTDILSIIRAHNLYEEFPPEVEAEAKKVAVPFGAEERTRRLDLTNELIFTIDPDDAKDLDDAVNIKINPDGSYKLGVHIADVSHYVTPDSQLDKEAFKRGTSVYFPDRVLPMLPRALSNNICSLHPGVERLCLSVFMDIDKDGKILNHNVAESVINSRFKLNYNQAQNILDGKIEEGFECLELPLRQMAALTKILERVRQNRGEIAFDIPEPKIVLDKKTGKICDVVAYPHWLSHRIIESFMICANEVVARDFCEKQLPFVYRIHEKPDPIKVGYMINMLKPFGIGARFEPTKVNGQHLQALLNNADESVRSIVAEIMLRSMQKAKYSESNVGHFGLGAEDYCHFTSPIRRLPDLAIHRITKLFLQNKLTKEEARTLYSFVVGVAKQGSETEKEADLAEREVDDLKKAEWMAEPQNQNKLFEGYISGITSFGIFVRLPNTVEGLIRMDMLPKDNYKFDEVHCTLIGNSHRFRMGDPIKVRVASVNLVLRKVNFAHELCLLKRQSFSPEGLKNENIVKQ